MKAFIFLAMIHMHIIDDYVLQGILAQMKQKAWWKKNAPDAMYKRDYLVALIMHSLSWAFSIMLPIAISRGFVIDDAFVAWYLINAILHAMVDNMKANQFTISLWEDQTIHVLQIVATFTSWMM